MRLTLTPLPSNVAAMSLLPNTDPASGVVTVTGRPTRHSWAFGQALLEGLGVNLDLAGAGRRHGENLLLLQAWLVAHDVKVIVIRHATNLPNLDPLGDLLHVTTATGTDLALTCDETVGESLAEWVTQHRGHIDTNHLMLLQRIASQTRPVPQHNEEQCDDFPALLPRVDFYAYRARCRDTLTPGQFALVDDLYCDVFRRVHADPFVTPTEAAQRLGADLTASTNPGRALTTARAAEAAMFTHGLLLKVHVPFFLRAVRNGDHRRLTQSELRALRAYRTPWRAAAYVLRDANLSRDTITTLTMRNVTDDGNLVGVEHDPLHDDAQVYLRAQRIMRTIEGAHGADLFITESNRSIGQAHRRVAVDLNLPMVSSRESSPSTKRDRWQTQLGVALLPLVTHRLPSPDDIKNGTPT